MIGEAILRLFKEPNPNDPYDGKAAKLYREDRN